MAQNPHAQSTNIPLGGQLEQLRLGAIWRAIWTQSPAIWLIQLYVFFEYVRPQTIYPSLDFLPWSQLTLGGAAVAVVVERRVRLSAKELWFAIGLLSLVVILSSLNAYDPAVSWGNWNIWLNWLLLMLIVGAGIRSRRELVLFLLAFGLWNLKMTQHGVRGWAGIGFGFRAIGIGGAPGWFQNSGEFGIEMCVFLPLSVYFLIGTWPRLGPWARRFMLAVVASAVISMIASSSRGALVGAAAIALWIVWRTPHRLKALVSVATVGAIIWIAVPAESKTRFQAIGEDKSSTTRITYWKHGIEIANSHPVLGIGYKNWLPYYRGKYNPRGELPHNFLVEAAAELGYLGLVAVVIVLVASFRATAQIRRRTSPRSDNPDRLLWALAYGLDGSLIGFAVSGSFVSVLYYPYLWMNVAMVMALFRVERERIKARNAVTRRSQGVRVANGRRQALGSLLPRLNQV